MSVLFFGGLGLIVGSFLNVVVCREATGEGIGGRSHCPHCKHTLSPLDLIPVVSWLLLRGRCRYCKATISVQYPLVEVTTALLFVFVGHAPVPPFLLGIGFLIVSLCIAIAVYDIKFMLIPDIWNYAFIIASFVFGAVSLLSLSGPIFFFLAGPLISLPLWAMWFFSGGRWMGFGDVKFALGMGWLLGIYNGYTALLGAFVIGAVISVCILLPLGPLISYAHRRGIMRLSGGARHFTMTSEVPFGPFLIASCLTIWLFTLYGISPILLW